MTTNSTTMSTRTPARAPAQTRTLGRIAVVASVLGAVSAVAIIAWPRQVTDTHYSYPFGSSAYALAQTWFSVQHLGLIAAMFAVTLLAWPSSTRLTRAGLVVGLVGMVDLTAWELVAVTARDALVDSDVATLVNAGYGPAVIAIGLGWVVAGVGLWRRPVLVGAGRWLPLSIGLYVFVVLLPSLMGPMTAGRIGIGVWMLLFAWLGMVLASGS